ncbi:hypothetical protein EVAR_85938_1 [Eumeta japonica]|uniref:Uncharacterized protein n=1 Tax=Eumeta variegata TaxID=151549 RepID=A0A4C2A808_EUMVA|nr:hypothetical protein EVAR_85938_1 [Eumeta japonica]
MSANVLTVPGIQSCKSICMSNCSRCKKNGGNVISNEDDEDKEPRHRQRREGISKENWRKLIKAHKSQTLIRRSGCKITNPQPNHTLIVSSKDKTHTGEHVLQIIRGYRHKEIRCESGKGPKARNQR